MQFENLSPKEIGNIAKIRSITPQDTDSLNQASSIYDLSLGQKYIPFDSLLEYSKYPDKYILIGSFLDQTLLGVMLALPLDNDLSEEFNNAFVKNNISIFLPKSITGVIKSVAVHPDFRHHGIGTTLTIEAMKRLEGMSTRIFTALSWDSGKPDSSPKMFEKLGYKNILRVRDYWYHDSLEKKYECPICGNPCHCNAIFYVKRV